MATASVTVKTTAGAFNKVEAGGKQHYFISRLLRAPHSRPVGERGVQLRVLKDLERYAVECCGPQPKSEEPTCRQVHDIIKELTQTQSGTCSLAELLPLEEGAPTKLVGVPEFYVSFRWTMPFTKIVEAVSHVVKAHYAERGRAEGTANDALVYLSLTALDRSAGWSVIWNDVTEVIQRTKHLIFVMDPDQEALTRLWMLWELATRAKAAADDGDDSASALLIFVGDMKFQHIQQLLHKLRDGSITGAGPAKASSPEDEALLKDTIKAQWGEYEKFATFVSNKVRA